MSQAAGGGQGDAAAAVAQQQQPPTAAAPAPSYNLVDYVFKRVKDNTAAKLEKSIEGFADTMCRDLAVDYLETGLAGAAPEFVWRHAPSGWLSARCCRGLSLEV